MNEFILQDGENCSVLSHTILSENSDAAIDPPKSDSENKVPNPPAKSRKRGRPEVELSELEQEIIKAQRSPSTSDATVAKKKSKAASKKYRLSKKRDESYYQRKLSELKAADKCLNEKYSANAKKIERLYKLYYSIVRK